MINDDISQEQTKKNIYMRLSNSQVANDTDQTAFDTFVQLESVELSGNASG